MGQVFQSSSGEFAGLEEGRIRELEFCPYQNVKLHANAVLIAVSKVTDRETERVRQRPGDFFADQFDYELRELLRICLGYLRAANEHGQGRRPTPCAL